MRKAWIITAIVILIVIGVLAGIYEYVKNKTQDINIIENKQLAAEYNVQTNNIISTSASEEKISPNAIVLEKQYFKGCDHLIKNVKDIPKSLINKNKNDLQKYYKDWDIDNFSSKEITVYQEKDGYCNQHYLIKEHNGVLGIYTIDEDGIINLKEDTEIQTAYLTNEDLEKVKEGITAIGDMELNSILEDFE